MVVSGVTGTLYAIRPIGVNLNFKSAVPLSPLVWTALEAERGRQRDASALLGSAWRGHGLVVCGEMGEPVSGQSLGRRFREALEAAGLPAVTFHGLRHSAASQLLSLGAPVTTVQKRLGHARASTTLDIYSHQLPGDQERITALWEQSLENGD